MQVFVQNKNDFVHFDRHNGIDYVFEPGQKLAIPVEAAAHMLGFGRADKTDNLIRLGWANRAADEGVKWLSKFVFLEAKLVESGEPAEDLPMPVDMVLPSAKKVRPDMVKPA